MSNSTVPFIVDSITPVSPDKITKQARSPFEHMLAGRATTKTLEVQLEALTDQIKDRISAMARALGAIDLSAQPLEIDQVKFTLSITASGKIAILATVEGSVSPSAGIEITLKPRKTVVDRE